MNKDREIVEALGECWHWIPDCNHPAREWYKTCSCGEHFNSGKEANEHVANINPDFTTDAGKVKLLKEMAKRDSRNYDRFLRNLSGNYSHIPADLILNTTGKLRDAAWGWLCGGEK